MTTSRGKILQEKTSAGLAWFLRPAKVVLGPVDIQAIWGFPPWRNFDSKLKTGGQL
jgi:hypothetical protein